MISRTAIDPVALSYVEKACAYSQNDGAEQAKHLYGVSIRTDNRIPEAWNDLGVLYATQRKFDLASLCFQRALQLKPDDPKFLTNFADVVWALEDYEVAVMALEKALEANPGFGPALYDLGMCHNTLDDLPTAHKYLGEALKVEPQNRTFMQGYIHNLLAAGQYKDGFMLYHMQIDCMETNPPVVLPFPRWQGEELTGKKLFITSKHGLGDHIQFLRYLAYMPATTGELIIETHPELVVLLSTSFTSPCRVTYQGYGAKLPQADYFCYLTDLPFLTTKLLGYENEPIGTPYFKRSLINTRFTLGPRKPNHFRVGIAWQGHTTSKIHTATAGLMDFVNALLPIQGIELYSLQVGPSSREVDAFDLNAVVTDLSPLLISMNDTADLLMELDAVVTIDTAMVHLCGALGIPTWVILRSHNPDWRWQRKRSDCVWYDSVHVFRKQRRHPWSECLQDVASALSEVIDGRKEVGPSPYPEIKLPASTALGTSTNLIACMPALLSSAQCASLVERFANHKSQFPKVSTPKGHEDGENIWWYAKEVLTGEIAEKLDHLIEFSSFHFDVVSQEAEDWRIAKYPVGGFMRLHRDAAIMPRNFGVVIMLNDTRSFDGGELKFPELDYVAPPVVGNAYIFPAHVLHEVTPVTFGCRYSLLSFLSDADPVIRRAD